MLFCMLRWYPIDTTTVPMWAYKGEVVFATSDDAAQGVFHWDLVVMCFIKVCLCRLIMLALGRCVTGILGCWCPIKYNDNCAK